MATLDHGLLRKLADRSTDGVPVTSLSRGVGATLPAEVEGVGVLLRF